MTLTTRLGKVFHLLKSSESTPGMLLLTAMMLALVLDNSPLAHIYDALLSTPAGIAVGSAALEKPLLLWINDGLMAIFFLLIGLEVKREVVEGHLSKPEKVLLPGIAAVGGMVVPALVYVMFNHSDPVAMKGWAIPVATDIAFALGILSLFGSRVPVALKVFLLSLAVIDDLGAIIIIAVFYTSNLSMISLGLAGVALSCMLFLNRTGVRKIAPYAIFGLIMWVCVLKSGVHATLAGVVTAFMIPLKRDAEDHSPLIHMEHALHPWVMFAIMPIFAFANAGVSLTGLSFEALTAPVPLGIAAGLFIGKQLGVFGFSYVAVKAGWAKLPDKVGWGHVYAVSLLTGVGFTMSLFVSSLAFEQGGLAYAAADRLGILFGSLISASAGALVLHLATREERVAVPRLA